MNAYITFTKKGLFIITAVIICVGFICFEIEAVSNKMPNAKTNAQRLSFIDNLGYNIISDQPSEKSVHIPEVFYNVYNNYNVLQKVAGYYLSLYKGCEVVIYTYRINPPNGYTDESVINLIVYKDEIIGGDVSSTALGGFMLPLIKEN